MNDRTVLGKAEERPHLKSLFLGDSLIEINSVRRYILGVDPGIGGAFALYDAVADCLYEIIDTPTTRKNNMTKREIDLHTLAVWVDSHANNIAGCVIEKVHSMPHQGVVSVFTFGKVFGQALGVIAAHYIPTIETPPSVWKALLAIDHNKEKSRKAAMALFPTHKKAFERYKDDGRAEAAMLAYFGYRQFTKAGTAQRKAI